MPAVATLITLLIGLQATEPMDIAHKYTTKDKTAYTIEGKADANGQEIKVAGEMLLEITRLLDGGRAESKFTMPKMAVSVGDMELPHSTEEQLPILTPSGLPELMGVKEAEMVSAMFFFSNIRPTDKIKIGDTFKIDFKTKDSSVTVKGSGKFVELRDVSGKKVVVLKSNLTVEPDGEAPGELVITSEYEQGGHLLKSMIDLTIEEVKGTFKITKKQS